MTYADPNRVRTNRVTARFDNYENKLITAIAEFKGMEPAVLIREIAVQAALEIVSFEPPQDMRNPPLNQAAEKQR